MSRSEKLIFKGTPKQQQYVSCDKDGNDEYTISCRQGDEIWVTPAKRADLLRDHGEWFSDAEPRTQQAPAPEVVKEPEPKPVEPEKVPEPEKPKPEPKPDPDFESMTNAELRKLAKTDNKRLSKKKLIEMITNKKKE